jgi:phosphatidylglycerophosphatase A
MRNPVHLLAAGFGSGLSRRAPGTWGTLAGIPLYLLLSPLPIASYITTCTALFFLGVWICGRAADDLGVHDHPSIVFDEMVGFLVTMVGIPVSWEWILTGFLLFRLFDIIKPWPISLLDRRMPGGLGIMLDDVAAGLAALALLSAARAVLT